jgi:hypothetical protein
VPYSSVRSEGRYIGFDIGLRTFLAAVENPQSVLYTENLTGKVSNAAAYYGSVCSAYTSYALGCGIWEVSRRYGPQISDGIRLVRAAIGSDAAQVGDVIYTPHATETSGSHVEMVTAVTKDAARPRDLRARGGKPPADHGHDGAQRRCLSTRISPRGTSSSFASRIARPGAARIAPSRCFSRTTRPMPTKPTINRTLLLDLGDWVPYQKGKPVKFNVMDRDQLGVKSLVIRRGDQMVEEIALEGPGVHERTLDTLRRLHRAGHPSRWKAKSGM